MLLALLFAGAAEGIGLSALLPLLNVAIGSRHGNGITSNTDLAEGSAANEMMANLLATVGIPPTIGALLIVIVVAITLKSGLQLIAKKYIGYTVAQVTTNLRLQLLRATLASRLEYFLHQPIGRLANAMATETLRSSQAYVFGTVLVSLIVQTLVYIAVALLVSWKATIACLFAGATVLSASHFLVSMSRRAGKRQTKLLKSLLARLTDTLQSVKPLKAMAREELADRVLTSATAKLNRALRKEVLSKAALAAAQEPMIAILISAGIFGALVYWKMPLATVLILVLLLARILNYLGRMQKQYQKMVTAESAYWSLQDTIEKAQQARETTSGGREPKLTKQIRLENIGLKYGEKTVLDRLAMTIPVGSLTTLIGRSGAGKTTIIDLIAGLIAPQAGHIYIDELPLDQLDIKKWRRIIGYVPQENLLLHDTVLNNVTLGDPELDRSDAERALHLAGAWDFVTAMPEGMDSTVGERGTRLSGGQRQRIMIARALSHRPQFLILDEATSALDPQSEAAICKTLQELRGKLTILAISHEPAMVHAADRVYRLQDGVAIEEKNYRSGPASRGEP